VVRLKSLANLTRRMQSPTHRWGFFRLGDATPDNFNPTEWITTSEAGRLTGYDVAHIRRLVREGRVRGMKFGRDWLVYLRSVQEYSDEMRRLGPAKHDPWRTGARRKDDGAE
jgi:excisionase family DNA binding protein